MTEDEKPTLEPLPIWIDGQVVAQDEARIDVRDPAFALGLSAIEGLRCEQQIPLFLERHLQRLERSAAVLGIQWPPPQDLEGALQDYALLLPSSPHYLRVQLTRGFAGKASLILTARPIEPLATEGVRLALAEGAFEWGPAASAKHSSRLPLVLAREAAQRRGAWDAILRDAQGLLVETTVANLFLVADGRLLTPDTGLRGTTRELILELAEENAIEVEQRPLALRELYSADEAFVTNVAAGVLAVQEVLEVASYSQTLPSLTRHLAELLETRRQTEIRAKGILAKLRTVRK